MDSVIHKCSFDNWYPVFRKDTVRGAYIELPDEFVNYLLNGEFFVDEKMFPGLSEEFQKLTKELGRNVFIKLNFSAPTDAQWIGPQRTLDVQTFEQAIYLLKASTRIMLDLTNPFGEDIKEKVKPVLVLKKSFDYKRGREFRIFYKNPETYWISSRYGDVPCEIEQEAVEEKVRDFIKKYENYFGTDKYILDLYISPKMRCHLVDMAPWNEATSPSMFEWDDIKKMENIKVMLASDTLILPRDEPPVPVELLGDASLEEIIASMKDLDNLSNEEYNEKDGINFDIN